MTNRRRRGFSLVELLMAIVVFGILALLALPKFRSASTRAEVSGARGAVANIYARARATAIQRRQPVTVNFNATSAWLTVPSVGGPVTVGPVADLATEYGVAVDATAATIVVQPTGLVTGGLPVTVRVTKSGVADSVVVTGYGRTK